MMDGIGSIHTIVSCMKTSVFFKHWMFIGSKDSRAWSPKRREHEASEDEHGQVSLGNIVWASLGDGRPFDVGQRRLG